MAKNTKHLYFNYSCYEKDIFDKLLKDVSTWQRFWEKGQAYMLVPEYCKLRVEEAYLKRYRAHSLMLADVKSFLRLASDLITQVYGENYKEISSQLNYLILLEDLEKKGIASSESLAEEYLNVMADLKRNGVTVQVLEDFLSQENEESVNFKQKAYFLDFIEHYRQFEDTLSSYGLKDKETRLSQATLLLKAYRLKTLSLLQMEALSFIEQLHLFIYGFGDLRAFSEQEVAFLSELFALVPQIHVYMTLDYCATWGEFSLEELQKNTPYYFSKWSAKQVLALAKQSKMTVHLNKLKQEPQNNLLSKAEVLTFSKEEELYAYTSGLLWDLIERQKVDAEDIALVYTGRKENLRFLLKDLTKLQLPYYIDDRQALSDGQLFQEIKTLKRFMSEAKSFEALSELLRSVYLNLPKNYLFDLENYLYAREYRGLASLKADIRTFSQLRDSERIQRCSQKIIQFLELLENSIFYHAKSLTLGEWVEQFVKLLDSLEFSKTFLKEVDLKVKPSAEHLPLFEDLNLQKVKDDKAFRHLLKNMHAFSMLQKKADKEEKQYTLTQFFSLLLNLASKIETEALPNRKGQIYIGSLEQGLQQGKSCFIVLDSQLAHFPCQMGSEGFLKDKDRQDLSKALNCIIPSKKRDLPYLSKVLSDRLLRNASQGLYLLAMQEKGCNPIFLKQVSSYAYQLKTKNVDLLEAQDLRYYSALYQERFSLLEKRSPLWIEKTEDLSEAFLNTLQSKTEGKTKYSISRVEKYTESPFAYFLSYVLRLKEREGFEINPALKGNLFHLVFEQVFKLLKEKLDAKEVVLGEASFEAFIGFWTEEKIQHLFDHALKDEEFKVYFDEGRGRREALRNYRLELVRLIPAFLNELCAYEAHEMVPTYFEQNFDVTLEEGLNLTGKIDRIDFVQLENEARAYRIVDYKTGKSQNIDYKSLYMGLDLQLPIYAQMFVESQKQEGKTLLPLWDMGYEKAYWNKDFEKQFREENWKSFYQGFEALLGSEFLEVLQQHSLKRLKEEIQKIENGVFPLEVRKISAKDISYAEEQLRAYAWRVVQKSLNDFSKEASKKLMSKKRGANKHEELQANFIDLVSQPQLSEEQEDGYGED